MMDPFYLFCVVVAVSAVVVIPIVVGLGKHLP